MSLSDLQREMARPLAAGDRVRSAPAPEWEGTVERVVDGATAGDRYLLVRWDRNGHVGRHSRAGLIKIATGETR